MIQYHLKQQREGFMSLCLSQAYTQYYMAMIIGSANLLFLSILKLSILMLWLKMLMNYYTFMSLEL